LKLKLSFERKSFTYTTPVTVGTSSVSSNTALQVSVNEEAMVDLTALSGLHHYTIEEWQYVLSEFFVQNEIAVQKFDLFKPAFGTATTNFTGELLYIVEEVLFAYLSMKKPDYFPQSNKEVLVNGLYSGQVPFEIVPNVVKIKIRQGEALQCLQAMTDCLSKNPDVLFRLDGNRTFEIESLMEFLKIFPKKYLQSVQYIEEPFKNYADNFLFKKMSSIPLALDESLISHLNHLSKLEENFFIVKPSLIGLSKSFEMATRFPRTTILSSSYETASAMKALTSIAALLPDQYHGFDTLKFLPKKFSI